MSCPIPSSPLSFHPLSCHPRQFFKLSHFSFIHTFLSFPFLPSPYIPLRFPYFSHRLALTPPCPPSTSLTFPSAAFSSFFRSFPFPFLPCFSFCPIFPSLSFPSLLFHFPCLYCLSFQIPFLHSFTSVLSTPPRVSFLPERAAGVWLCCKYRNGWALLAVIFC